jgi:transcriptional regulator
VVVRVELHVARANPIHELTAPAGRPALLTCTGPDAYISPNWYGVPNQVPTWTYTAVHLTGTAHI